MGNLDSVDVILINAISRNYDGSLSDSPQLGLVYIATFLRLHKVDASILSGDDLYEVLKLRLEEKRPRKIVVGFYSNSDNIFEVERLAKFAKGVENRCSTIVGGPLASVEHARLLQSRYIDFAARDDGEHLMLELTKSIAEGKADFSDIEGLSWKSCRNEIITNSSRPTFRDLDELPMPNRDLYQYRGLGLQSQIVTSRGCGFRCTFCFESTNRKYREHSPSRVIDEIKYLQDKYGTRYFTFVDDIFTANHKRVRKLCDLFINNFKPHKDFFWYCEARVDTLEKFPDLIPLMQQAGLTRIQIGSESGAQNVIDAYKKQIRLPQIRSAVEQCVDADVLSIFTNFIIGGALETRETVASTQKLASELLEIAPGRFECNTTFLSPYPGTDIAFRPEAYDVKILDQDFSTGLSDDYIFVETQALSKRDILELERNFTKELVGKMINSIPKIEMSLLLRHLEMNLHGLQTKWSDLIRTDPIIGSASRLLKSGSYFRALKGDDIGDISQTVPLRTFSLRDWQNDSYFWKSRRRRIALDEYEFWLLEQCAGKLSISDILDKSISHWKFDVEANVLANDIENFFVSLSQEGLLVFRSIGHRETKEWIDAGLQSAQI